MQDLDLSSLYATLSENDPSCGLPVYCSIDIRDSGDKICAVDVNLFPAGFNNIGEAGKEEAGRRMRSFFSAKLLKSAPWKITVVPEAHTNNFGYLENLADILEILKRAGAEVQLLWSGPAIPKPWTIKTKSGKELVYLPPEIALENPDAILLNHDLSGGIPNAIRDLNIPIFPSPKLGWYRRKKSTHFEISEALLKKLQKHHPTFDPWRFSAQTQSLGDLNMDSNDDIEKIMEAGHQLFSKLREDYKTRGISRDPYIYLKNDAGTYGMGVMSFLNEAELESATSKIRKKMRVGKESVKVDRVILQEGIPSAYSSLDGAAAEPVLYLVHGTPVGGFYRVHRKLGDDALLTSLNQPGSTLESLDSPNFQSPQGKSPRELLKMGQAYHFISRVHAIAAGLEECPL